MHVHARTHTHTHTHRPQTLYREATASKVLFFEYHDWIVRRLVREMAATGSPARAAMLSAQLAGTGRSPVSRRRVRRPRSRSRASPAAQRTASPADGEKSGGLFSMFTSLLS